MAQVPRIAYRILGVAFLLGFFVLDSIFVVSPMLPLIMKEFSLSFSTAGLLFSIPIILFVITSFFAGILGDKLGIKRTAGIGAILLAVGSPARALSSDFATLVFFTAFLGGAYGFLLPTLPKMVSAWFPPQTLGKATGVYINGLYLGAAFGVSATIPVLYPFASSWRGTVLITGTLAVISAALWWLLVKEPPKQQEESREKIPGAMRSAWLNRTTVVLAIILTMGNVHFYTLGTWLPTFLGEKGVDASTSGLIASLPLFAAIPANIAIPFVSDRWRKRKPFLWLTGAVNAGAFIMLISTPLFFQPAAAAILGFSLGSIFVMVYVVPVESTSYSSLGRAMGFIVSLGFLGGVIGPYVAGLIRDLSGNFAIVFIAEAALSIVISILAFTLPETGTKLAKKPGV